MEERFLWMDWCLVGGKKKKILGFCKINDCVMWNYNVFIVFLWVEIFGVFEIN